MPNLIELIDKAPMIKSKISIIVEEIKNDIDNGIIKNQTEAYIKLRDKINIFVKSLTDSILEVITIDKLALSSDINTMFDNINIDLNNIDVNVSDIETILTTTFNQISIERNIMYSMFNYMSKTLTELEDNIPSILGDNIKIYTDSFTNYSLYDTEIINGNLCSIDTIAGILTLGRSNANFYTPNTIAITDNSNGFPGDTHQAMTSNTFGESIIYSGELDAHTNLEYLTDNKKDTWFEYENIKIEDKDYDLTKGYGFEYKEGIRWITENDKLTLELTLTFNIARNMNWLYIDPYLTVENSYIASNITKIILDDGKGNINELTDTLQFKREIIKIFNNQKIKTITILFEQINSYKTLVAHKYYVQSLINNNILLPSLLNDIRIDGENPTVELVGLTYEPTTGVFKQPVMDMDYNVPNTKLLFTYNSIDKLELLNAFRYQIGIRSIEFGSIEFLETSEYISSIYTFDSVINSFSITSDDSIPSDFVNDINTYIKYSLSADNGKTWTTIIPYRNGVNGETLTLNNTSIRVKISLSRPITNTNKYLTPIVYSYSIKGSVY